MSPDAAREDGAHLRGWSDAQLRAWAGQVVLAGRIELAEVLRRWDEARTEAARLREVLAQAGIEV